MSECNEGEREGGRVGRREGGREDGKEEVRKGGRQEGGRERESLVTLFLCHSISGTLRPDLIESASSLASGHADVIKTHHNDTKLVRYMRQQVR